MTDTPDTNSEWAVEISHLHKVFKTPWKRTGVHAVKDINITIPAGTVYGLIGPNGSGKSTTMKALLGLVRPSSGNCMIFGVPGDSSAALGKVGFLPENAYFYKFLTGYETLKFYGKLSGLQGKALQEKCQELLALVHLEDAADRRLSGYSKGMLQRIGLAQSLISNPKLLVLDEPTAGVDPIGSRLIRDIILNLKEQGMTVFLCSHLLEQVQEVCDQVGIIFRGKMITQGTLDSLINIEDSLEFTIRNASPELIARIKADIAQDANAELLQIETARTSLEKLFMEKINS